MKSKSSSEIYFVNGLEPLHDRQEINKEPLQKYFELVNELKEIKKELQNKEIELKKKENLK